MLVAIVVKARGGGNTPVASEDVARMDGGVGAGGFRIIRGVVGVEHSGGAVRGVL